MTTYAETALVSSLGYLAQAQQAISHNLANVNSNAFKRRQAIAEVGTSRFHGMLEQTLPIVRYREATDWSPGNLVATGELNHVALESQADFFRVRGTDGRTYLTRSGELQVDAQGFLADEAGYRYLDTADQEVQVRVEGDDSNGFTVTPAGELLDARSGLSLNRSIGVFRVADRDALLPVGKGRFLDQGKQDVVAVPTNAVKQGNVEASNVETVSEMVSMLVIQRSFQATSNILRSIGQLQSTFVNAMAR